MTNDAPLTATERLDLHVRDRGDSTAFLQKRFGIWHATSWASLAGRVAAVAHGYALHGLGRGARLAILSENRIEAVVAQLAVNRIGGAAVCLQPGLPEGTIAWQVQEGGATAIVCEDQEQIDKVLAIRARLPELARIYVFDPKGLEGYDRRLFEPFGALEALAGAPEQSPVHPDAPALVLFTAAAYDRPRAVTLTHRTLAESADAFAAAVAARAGQTAMSPLPIAGAPGQALLVQLPLAAGVTATFPESLDTISNDVRELAPHMFVAAPRTWDRLRASLQVRLDRSGAVANLLHTRLGPSGPNPLMREVFALPLLRHVGLARAAVAGASGGVLSHATQRFFRRLGCDVRNIYAETDIGGFVAAGTAKALHPRAGLKWQLDERDQLWIRNGSTWIATGNAAEAVSGGFRLIGRLSDRIAWAHGEAVDPLEIENALKASPFVREAVAIGDPRTGFTALIEFDPDFAAQWADRRKLSYTTYRTLAELPEIGALASEAVAAANSALPADRQIARFLILPRLLDPAEGDLTALLTVRRAALRNRHAHLLLPMLCPIGTGTTGGNSAMRIAILGAGNVGATLGKGWAAKGHQIVYGVRNPDSSKTAAVVAQTERGRAATVAAAAAEGEVVALATPWETAREAVRAAGDLSGKALIDCTNPLTTNLTLEVGHTKSGAELIAELAPGAHVVKAFNTTGWNIMADTRVGQASAVMLVCGDHQPAKNGAIALATDLGFEAIDAGRLEVARLLEPMAALWIHLAYRQGLGRDYAFALARR